DRANRVVVYAAGQAVSALLALAVFLLPLGVVVSALLAAAFGLANATSRPSLMAIAVGLSSERRGTTMGLVSCSNQTGWALGAALGGLALTAAGWEGIAALTAAGAILAAAAIAPAREKSSVTGHQSSGDD